jgi:hypothetical protein
MDDLVSIFVIIVLLLITIINIIKTDSLTGIVISLFLIIITTYIIIYLY